MKSFRKFCRVTVSQCCQIWILLVGFALLSTGVFLCFAAGSFHKCFIHGNEIDDDGYILNGGDTRHITQNNNDTDDVHCMDENEWVMLGKLFCLIGGVFIILDMMMCCYTLSTTSTGSAVPTHFSFISHGASETQVSSTGTGTDEQPDISMTSSQQSHVHQDSRGVPGITASLDNGISLPGINASVDSGMASTTLYQESDSLTDLNGSLDNGMEFSTQDPPPYQEN